MASHAYAVTAGISRAQSTFTHGGRITSFFWSLALKLHRETPHKFGGLIVTVKSLSLTCLWDDRATWRHPRGYKSFIRLPFACLQRVNEGILNTRQVEACTPLIILKSQGTIFKIKYFINY